MVARTVEALIAWIRRRYAFWIKPSIMGIRPEEQRGALDVRGAEQLARTCVASALATVGAQPPSSR